MRKARHRRLKHESIWSSQRFAQESLASRLAAESSNGVAWGMAGPLSLREVRGMPSNAYQVSGAIEKLISVTPEREVARVWPPCIRAMAATIAKPSPWCSDESVRDRSARKNRLNRLGRTSSGTGSPRLATLTKTPSGWVSINTALMEQGVA